VPIPPLTAYGYLPDGIYHAHIEEVFETFVKGKSQRRLDIWNGMNRFIQDYSGIIPDAKVYLDGSYISGKNEPGDIEVIIEFGTIHWPLYCQKIHVIRDQIKSNYLVDVWPQFPGQPNDFLQFFQYIRNEEKNSKGLPPSTQKGILVVEGVAI
jgi:hypothetical protein